MSLGVIMPVKYFHPPFLRAAIQSVLDQTSGDWSLYVSSDGDLDSIYAVLDEFPADERIAVIEDGGGSMTTAINRAMRASSEAFVSILHGDDMLAGRAVETMLGEMKSSPDVDFFHSARTIIGDDEKPIPPTIRPAKERVNAEGFVHGGMAKHMLCWNREKAISIGGLDERFGPHGADDYEFPWTCAEHGFRFKAVQEPLYIYRDHSLYRVTTHIPLSIQVAELTAIFRKHGIPAEEIAGQIKARKAGYLRQALYP